tara:strand:+ start:112 stop:477 length:366 start_codon:yes stop_codon:yes gene_type:complete
MSELRIPNLNNRSRQFLFKNKLTIRRKSKTKILSESLFMFIFAFILIFLNLLIPQKKVLFYSFMDNIYKIYVNLLDFIKYFYQIILVLLIVSSALVSVMLIVGALSRIYKIIIRKTKKYKY